MRIQRVDGMFNGAVPVQSNYRVSIPKLNASNGQDIFIKNSSNVSFSGKKYDDAKENLMNALRIAGFVGVPFLCSVTMAAAIAKQQNPEKIFLSDGSFFANASDLAKRQDEVLIDRENKSFQAKDAGIDLNPERFDFVNVRKGIYKNYDGSADINLSENKYIDRENGIFIDEKDKMSLIENDGIYQNVLLPSFKSGYPTRPEDPRWYGHSSPITNDDRNDDIPEHSHEFDDREIVASVLDKYNNLLPPDDMFNRQMQKVSDTYGLNQTFIAEAPSIESVEKFIEKHNIKPEIDAMMDEFKEKVSQDVEGLETDYTEYDNNGIPDDGSDYGNQADEIEFYDN